LKNAQKYIKRLRFNIPKNREMVSVKKTLETQQRETGNGK
jgi:hypothetical protein